MTPAFRYLLLAAVSALTLGVETAAAGPELESEAEPARIYEPAFYARFSPISALGMVSQTPGFEISEGAGRRGLGQGGANVLINSRRIPKTTSAGEALSRIPADRVVRVELIDGARLDIPGLSGQVANVVTRSGGISKRWSWRPQVQEDRPALLAKGKLLTSGAIGGIDHAMTLGVDHYGNGSMGPEYVLAPDGALLDTREEDEYREGVRYDASLDLAHETLGGTLTSLSLSGSTTDQSVREYSERSGAALGNRFRQFREDYERTNLEIGGDLDIGLGAGRLKLTGLHEIDTSSPVSETQTDYLDLEQKAGSRVTTERESGESILRSEFSWLDGADNDWQASLEGAFNYLDTATSLDVLSGGVFVDVALPGATSRVEEKRAEAALAHGQALTDSLSVQASVGAEYSELAQTGPNGKVREFVRPKGFLAVSWDVSPTWNVDFRAERSVGQLNFGDFVSSVNLNNEQDQNQSGNPEIVPSQSWDYAIEATGEIGLLGHINVRLYDREIEDVTTSLLFARIIEPDGDITISQGPGNLDEASSYGIDMSGTMPLDHAGLAGAKLDWSFGLADSSVTDAVTGEDRPLSGTGFYHGGISFRQDLPTSDWAWGAGYSQRRGAASYGITQLSHGIGTPGAMHVFVQNKDLLGVNARLQVSNILGTEDRFYRIDYLGTRADSIESLEQRVRRRGLEVSFDLSGSF